MADKKKGPHVGHRKRVRERYDVMGLDGFAPHEALELLLFYTIPMRDVNPLAHALIDEFGSLDACLSAGVERLSQVPGIGEKTARFLTMVGESCDLYASFNDNRLTIDKYTIAVDYIRQLFKQTEGLHTWAMCMDRSGRLVGTGIIGSRGWSDEGIPKAALKLVVKYHASTLMLVDKRKNEDLFITDEDVDTAERISKAMMRLSVLAIDMIIASDDDTISLRKQKAYDPTLNLREANDNLTKLFTTWLG